MVFMTAFNELTVSALLWSTGNETLGVIVFQLHYEGNSPAAAALAVVRGDEPPDLVFSDIVMAGELDGVDLARQLREEFPAMPVLLATGYSKSAARTGDAFPVLRKPYQVDDLDRSIRALLAGPPPAPGKSRIQRG